MRDYIGVPVPVGKRDPNLPPIIDGDGWPGFEEAAKEFVVARDLKAQCVKRLNKAELVLIKMIRSARVRGAGVGGLVVYLADMDQYRFDVKRFRLENPALWEKYKAAKTVLRIIVVNKDKRRA